MSELKDVNTNEVKKRGRPRKDPPQQINEQKEVLKMSENVQNNEHKNVTVENIRANLTGIYNKLLFGKDTNLFGASGEAWMGSLLNFNQYNPFLQNQRLKMINAMPGEMDMETLTKALSNPGGSEEALRR